MRRALILGLPLLALVAVGAFFYLRGRPHQPVPAPPSAVEDLLTKPYTESGPGYTISAAYPTTTPIGEGAAEVMQEWVIGEISKFKDGGPEAVDFTKLPAGQKAALEIDFEIQAATSSISYVFNKWEDYGMAHGYTSGPYTFTFDKQTGVMLSTPQ